MVIEMDSIMQENEPIRICKKCGTNFTRSNNSICRFHQDNIIDRNDDNYDMKRLRENYDDTDFIDNFNEKNNTFFNNLRWSCCDNWCFKLKEGHSRENSQDLLKHKGFYVFDHSTGCQTHEIHVDE